jgi:hypothetical protein
MFSIGHIEDCTPGRAGFRLAHPTTTLPLSIRYQNGVFGTSAPRGTEFSQDWGT